MARARRAWLLLAAAASGAACAQVLDLKYWVPEDAGAGGQASTTSSTGGQPTSGSSTTSSTSTSSTSTSSTSTSASSSAGSTASSSSSSTSSTSASSSTGALCSTKQPVCGSCQDCANLLSGPCSNEYNECAGTDADAGGCAAALDCLYMCGNSSNCATCPSHETAVPKLFPMYKTCLCQQCVASCTGWASSLCP